MPQRRHKAIDVNATTINEKNKKNDDAFVSLVFGFDNNTQQRTEIFGAALSVRAPPHDGHSWIVDSLKSTRMYGSFGGEVCVMADA
eukprot:scaffold823_cov219-Amphora_coffeaeformis.AAC.8